LRSVIMLYLQCFYSTASNLTSDIYISAKMDMYHYKIDTTICLSLMVERSFICIYIHIISY